MANSNVDQIRAAAAFGVEARRWLHRHPELGFHEQETMAYVASRLREIGYEPETGIGGIYAVKAVLRGGRPGRTIALRADMDALPIQEATGLAYASEVAGIMHACGHDMHTATLLAAAKLLKPMAPELAGNVVFIFQPAEEVPPGGARTLVEAGILENPHVDAVFGLHVDPFLPAGQLSFAPGATNAAADSFSIHIQGKGGHGAAPHQTIDALVVGAQVVTALQQIHSRMISPFDQLVISVGRFQAGTARNIIADDATLEGTVRTTSPQLRERVVGLIEQVTAGVCATHGATYKCTYEYGYPVLVNDATMTEVARAAAVAAVGADAVRRSEPGMYGEDFAYYAQQRPAAFGNLGAGDPAVGPAFPCHHPKLYVADEQAMPTGLAFYLNLVTAYLRQ
ncbi:MAG: M20 metallopeptidase family protein [Mycobacterium leprae]